MHKNRLRVLNHNEINHANAYVLYWLQHTQRIEYNYALAYAIKEANRLEKPLVVLFVLTPDFPLANTRHYQFMLEGIVSLYDRFKDLNITFNVEVGDFETHVRAYQDDACLTVVDDAYLKELRKTKETLASSLDMFTVQVISDLIVPPHIASDKCEYSARTIRPKLLKVVDDYLDVDPIAACDYKANRRVKNPTLEALLKHIKADDITRSHRFIGGYDNAKARLDAFIESSLELYKDSNDPSKQLTSTLSPYLHFGQIAPVEIYLMIDDYKDSYPESVDNYLEQLLVRRELAYNFVWFCKGYDHFDTMTYEWAYKTMDLHLEDARDYHYTDTDYVSFNTHDVYFNAAMKEMVKTGYMHNYMRMYWAKKIIEWSPDYEAAYATIITLNNRFFIDGRDPVSYASVAWVFGRHDRAWTERPIFGKLRYMNANGLKRKFDIDAYKNWADTL